MSNDQQEVYASWEEKQRAKYGERPIVVPITELYSDEELRTTHPSWGLNPDGP